MLRSGPGVQYWLGTGDNAVRHSLRVSSPPEHKDDMTSTSANQPSPEASHVRHYHHGQTPAAWAGSLLGLLAVLVGGVAMVIGPNRILFWIAVVIAVVALIVTQAIRRAGRGAN